MKIQSLAIIFIIIILPIVMVLAQYTNFQKTTFELEDKYDSKLMTSTRDALKAFQINTFNNSTSDIVDSKINTIEASANAFYNSMEASFNMHGYSKQDLRKYTPALVYTMYDGYYIYSPYVNIATGKVQDTIPEINLDETNKNIEYGFKPYVYYNCRYKGTDYDIIINYSLDNYITVRGMIGTEYVNKSGYLISISDAKFKNGLFREVDASGNFIYYYNGEKIEKEVTLSENIIETWIEGEELKGESKEYPYIKLNGTKYYLDTTNEYIFYISNNGRAIQARKSTQEEIYNNYKNLIENNNSAICYYNSAYEFTQWVKDKLENILLIEDAVDFESNQSGYLFKDSNISFEYSTSLFNEHRKAVIRHSIESNLSVAITNFNTYLTGSNNYEFAMPKLKETDWDILENEISIISFLQGLNIGAKIYNGYAVVANDKTEEFVKEEYIYITTDDGYYHKINDKHLLENEDDSLSKKGIDIKNGTLKLDFQVRKDPTSEHYYLPQTELGCYTSIVAQENTNNYYNSIYEYLVKQKENNKIDKKLLKTYYTALGRERWGAHKVENNLQEIIQQMN